VVFSPSDFFFARTPCNAIATLSLGSNYTAARVTEHLPPFDTRRHFRRGGSCNNPREGVIDGS
jgi:hypothetical protein